MKILPDSSNMKAVQTKIVTLTELCSFLFIKAGYSEATEKIQRILCRA